MIDRARIVVRRRVLFPGQATPWHIDPCHRHTVVVRGDRVRIEFRDGAPAVELAVAPGLAEWDLPTPLVHRAVNVGRTPYEEVVMFFLDAPDVDPQPVVAAPSLDVQPMPDQPVSE
jgi:hypothetical protein